MFTVTAGNIERHLLHRVGAKARGSRLHLVVAGLQRRHNVQAGSVRVDDRSLPVPGWTVTRAPATTAPLGSVTIPESEDVDCPHAPRAPTLRAANYAKQLSMPHCDLQNGGLITTD